MNAIAAQIACLLPNMVPKKKLAMHPVRHPMLYIDTAPNVRSDASLNNKIRERTDYAQQGRTRLAECSEEIDVRDKACRCQPSLQFIVLGIVTSKDALVISEPNCPISRHIFELMRYK